MASLLVFLRHEVWNRILSNRAAEYSLLIFEIIEDDAMLRSQGLPGLSVDEINQLRILVQTAIEQIENGIKEMI